MSKRYFQSCAAAFGLLSCLAAPAYAATPAADLFIASGALSHEQASAGDKIAVTCSVANQGDAISGSSRLKYYFSTDATLDSGDKYLNYDNVDPLGLASQATESANVTVPNGTTDGPAFILLVADYDQAVSESDEQNNVLALALSVGSPAPILDGPDFVVGGAAIDAVRAYPSEQFSASCAVVNQGSAPVAFETRLKYYLSTDTFFGPDDIYLNYDRVSALSAGAQSVESANLRVPASAPDGLYYVLFVADQTELVAEPDEQNNVTAIKLLVGDYTPAADLVIASATTQATTVKPGETIAVDAEVYNSGDAEAASTTLKYFLSADALLDAGDKQLSYDKVDVLAAGAKSPEDAALRIKESTAGGNWFLLFVADAGQTLAEHSEDNNLVALPIFVDVDDPGAFLPDLVVAQTTLAADTVASGDTVAVAAIVKNQGPATAGASRLKYFLSTDAAYDSSDRYLNYDNVGQLASQQSGAEQATLTIPAVADGSYFILFVVDHTEEVTEQYESNNVLPVPLTVGAPDVAEPGPEDDPNADAPDLMVVEASVDSVLVEAGQRAALKLSVENVGTQSSVQSRVKYYLSRDETLDTGDKYAGYDTVPALAPGQLSEESATPLVPLTADHGSWYLLLLADANDDVAERFESNNLTVVAIQVVVDDPEKDAADLLVTSVALDKQTVAANSKLALSITVENDGVQPADPSRFKVYLSQDALLDDQDSYLDYRRVDSLLVGEQQALQLSVRIPLDTANGSYQLLLAVDVNREVDERYESNNLLAVAITVGADDGPAEAFPYACPESITTDSTLLAKHTVATFNALHLGWNNSKDMAALACVVSHFDVVGLVEVDQPQGLVDLEQELELITGQDWAHHVSPHDVGNDNGKEYYGYVWRTDAAQMTAALGFFDDSSDVIKREPYGASFAMGNADFTLVVFHQRYGNVLSDRRSEAAHLIDIYQYFQALNGPNEQDVLIGGDFNLPGDDVSFSLVGYDDVSYITDPEQPTSIGQDGLTSSFDNIFFSETHVGEMLESGAYDYTKGNHATLRETVSDHIPVWIALDTAASDDD